MGSSSEEGLRDRPSEERRDTFRILVVPQYLQFASCRGPRMPKVSKEEFPLCYN